MSRRLRNLTVTLLCLSAVAAGLAELLTPATELVRFRNALLASAGTPADFDWTPDKVPAEYRLETLPPPSPLAESARELATDVDSGALMFGIVSHLRSQPKRKGPIKSTTVEAYRQITQTGRGYCADYTQVFNGLAHALALPVREWGMSFDRFSGDGHAFNEAWDAANQQWVFVDSFHGFYVRDKASGNTLSALEFRTRLLNDDGFDSLIITPIGDAFRFDSPLEAYSYYQKGADQFYLWFGNHVFSYDRHAVVRFFGPVSRSVEQLAAIVAGIHPGIRIFPTDTNRASIDALLRFRSLVIMLTLAAVILALGAVVQLVRLYRRRPREQLRLRRF